VYPAAVKQRDDRGLFHAQQHRVSDPVNHRYEKMAGPHRGIDQFQSQQRLGRIETPQIGDPVRRWPATGLQALGFGLERGAPVCHGGSDGRVQDQSHERGRGVEGPAEFPRRAIAAEDDGTAGIDRNAEIQQPFVDRAQLLHGQIAVVHRSHLGAVLAAGQAVHDARQRRVGQFDRVQQRGFAMIEQAAVIGRQPHRIAALVDRFEQ
jgi:hypothetical protein